MRASSRLWLALVAAAVAGCGGDGGASSPAPPPPTPPLAASGGEAAVASPSRSPVVVLGDSIAAGLGLAEEQAFPAVLEKALAERGIVVPVVNAGVSGDTSAGGVRRVSWLMRQRPALVIVELGANDAMRGQPLEGIEENLRRIVVEARAAGAGVLLLGMDIPTNYGAEYSQGFAAMYPRLAAELGVALVPSFLDGVGGMEGLNLPDGIHPNAEGQRRLAEKLVPYVEEQLSADPDA